MERVEWDKTVTSPSTQLDPGRMMPRETFRESPHWQPSGTTQPQPIFVEDIGFRGEFHALVKQVEFIQDRITTNPVTINTLGNDNWELKHPLNVTVEQRAEDQFIACLYDVNLYGYGETVPEALDDLKEAIVNQLEFLSEEVRTVELGIMPRKQLNFLRKILVPADA